MRKYKVYLAQRKREIDGTGVVGTGNAQVKEHIQWYLASSCKDAVVQYIYDNKSTLGLKLNDQIFAEAGFGVVEGYKVNNDMDLQSSAQKLEDASGDGSQNFNPLGFSGALGRACFFVYLIIVYAGFYYLSITIVDYSSITLSYDEISLGDGFSLDDGEWLFVLPMLLVLLVVHFSAFIKRTRDAGFNIGLSLLGSIPGLALPYGLLLLFCPSAHIEGQNAQTNGVSKFDDKLGLGMAAPSEPKAALETKVPSEDKPEPEPEQKASKTEEISEDCYARAAIELFSDNYDQELWEKVYVEAGEDEAEGYRRYIKIRAAQLGRR